MITPANADIRIVVAAVLSTTASVFPAFVTGSLGVQIRDDLGFGEAGLGLAAGMFFATATVGSITAGRLAQQLGAVRALRIGLFATGLIVLAIAVLADGLLLLTIGVGLAGIANSLTQPAANLLLAGHLPPERLGLGVAIKQSGMPTGTLLAGLAVPAVALTVGWRWAYIVGIGLVLLALLALSRIGHPAISSPARGRPDLRMGQLVLLASAIAAGAFAAGGLASWLVSSAEASGISEGFAGVLLAVGSAAGITSRLVMGARADRTRTDPLRTAGRMLAIGACAIPLLGTDLPAVSVAIVPVAFAAGWAWPGLFNLAVMRANPTAPAAATGVTQTGTYIGALAGPIVMGLIIDRRGYDLAWLVAGVVGLAGATLMLIASRRLSDP